jgi:hypothetical protein
MFNVIQAEYMAANVVGVCLPKQLNTEHGIWKLSGDQTMNG